MDPLNALRGQKKDAKEAKAQDVKPTATATATISAKPSSQAAEDRHRKNWLIDAVAAALTSRATLPVALPVAVGVPVTASTPVTPGTPTAVGTPVAQTALADMTMTFPGLLAGEKVVQAVKSCALQVQSPFCEVPGRICITPRNQRHDEDGADEEEQEVEEADEVEREEEDEVEREERKSGGTRRPSAILSAQLIIRRSGSGVPSELTDLQLRSTSLGCCLASCLVLIPSLRQCFSVQVQPLLQTAAIITLFCSGCSLEETSFLCFESVLGTLLAILNAAAIGHFIQDSETWVIVVSVAFVAIACLLPLSETTKQYTVGLTAYFTMDLLTSKSGGQGEIGEIHVLFMCLEYMSVSLLGSLCALLVYSVPLPGLPDTRALKSGAAAFKEIVEGCAEVVKEATEAFLFIGAGDAWRALGQQRLSDLSETLAEAKCTAEYENLSPLAVWRNLRHDGRLQSERQHLQQETAFSAAAETLDVCCLLCELAAKPHGTDLGAEAALVRGAAEESIRGVALDAAALLRDFGRADFGAAALGESNATATRRKILLEAAKGALQKSRNAAQEILNLRHFQSHDAMLGTNSFASARSEMASFLFLVHVLATELLQSESSFLRKALKQRDGSRILAGDEEEGLVSLTGLSTWHLSRESRTGEFRHLTSLTSPLLPRREFSSSSVNAVPPTCYDLLAVMSSKVHTAVSRRWRCSLKVSLSYCLGLILDFNNGLDGVMVCTVSYLCSYGSQYSGGSLRRAISRGVGVSAGATVGSVLRTLCIWSSDLPGTWDVSIVVTLLIILGWTFLSTLVNFRGGPYAYAGFCAAFTAIKFLSSTGPGGMLQLSATITSCMWACLLVVLVETCILPVDARDLLQGRVVAALMGVRAVLPALVSADESLVKSVKEDGPYGFGPGAGVSSWPDLTERLKKVGAYEKYLEWREGYMRWRMGESHGAKGEIVLDTKTAPVAPVAPVAPKIGKAKLLRDDSDLGTFQPRDPAPHLASKNLEENTPKEGVQLMMAPRGDMVADMPEVAAVLHPVAVPSLKELLNEEGDWQRQESESRGKPITVSLASIQEVLDEIRDALAPIEELALQAAERLDGLKLDGNAWCSFADRLRIMRLWLSVLGRIAKRLGHGCSLTDLIGADNTAAAEDLLNTVRATLAAAVSSVAGDVPLAAECAKLEVRLRSSRQGLLAALGRRASEGRNSELAAEVLALSAGHALMALLADAGRCLALSVRMATSAEDEASPSPYESPQPPRETSISMLPDLTERLKQQGQYEKYVKWRDGYRQWRSGGISGSKGEIVENSTT
eukprot:s1190_g12.t1